MIKIKLSINSPIAGLLRQTPNNDGVWGAYKFFINEDVEECDYWVVYSKGEKSNISTKVASQNMIFISGEPEPIYHYAKRFIKNFHTVITTRKDINHPNIINLHPAQPWWVGRKMKETGEINFSLTFNELEQSPRKSKLISVISSNKGFTKGHNDRINFVKKLKDHFGNTLDVFGKGINGFEDKWDTLKDYKYHIVLENSSFPDYWTEKLADCYLAEAFPFYYGCKNLDKYFPKESYKSIDIYNVEKTINTIEVAIKEDLYTKRLNVIKDAKNLLMNTHNIFPMLCDICDNLDSSLPKKSITIKHEQSYIDLGKIPMILSRLYFKYLYKNE